MDHKRAFKFLVALIAVSACTKDQPPKKTMTQRERDSAIGASNLPGAAGVRGALRVQDSAQARNNRLDTIQ